MPVGAALAAIALKQLYLSDLYRYGGNGMPDALSPRGHALRKGRHSETGGIYLLTTVLRGRQPLFRDMTLARLLINELRLAHDRQQVSSLAWVVMPDHLHWLVQLGDGQLHSLMRQVKSRSAMAINRTRGMTGAIWQEGFHDRALRNEENVRDAARYIVANPLRAGLVSRLAEYPFWDAIWL
jgi:putative transposase